MSDENVFPIFLQHGLSHDSHIEIGLTKREYFAAMAMQGILSDRRSLDRIDEISKEDNVPHASVLARLSAIHADALINELKNKP